MPQLLEDMVRDAQKEVAAENKKKGQKTSAPAAAAKLDAPAAGGLEEQVKKAKQEVEQENKQSRNQGDPASALSRWGWVYKEPLEAGKRALQGVGAAAIHTGINLADLPQYWMSQNIPGYIPDYLAASPKAQELATPPPGFWGGAGYTGEQMAEMWLTGKLVPGITGEGLLPGAGRIAREAAVGGGVTGLQTGSGKEALVGAGLGAAGGAVGEAAGRLAPAKAQEALPWTSRVDMGTREEAARRAVQRGAVVPITTAEERAAFPHLTPEIAKYKGVVDGITKKTPAVAQRTIPIRDVLEPVNKMIRDVRPSDPDIARALARKRDQWLKSLGFQPYKAAVPATAAQVTQVPVMGANGQQMVDQFGRPQFRNVTIPGKPGVPAVPARTTTTVAEVQKFKESFNALPESAFGQKPRAAAKIEAKLATRRAAKEAIEEAVPDRFKQYGDRTVQEMNRIIERDIRLREAITRAIKKGPGVVDKGLGAVLVAEAGESALKGRLDPALIAGTALAKAYSNPLRMTRLLVWLRDSGVALPATAYAAWRSALEDPTYVGETTERTSGTGGGVGAPQPAPAGGGGGRGAPRAAAAPLTSPSATSGLTPEVQKLLMSASSRVGVPLDMLTHIAKKETGGLKNPAEAVSPKGAVGVMQLMPATAADYGLAGEDLKDPAKNIDVGARYLRWILDQVHWDRDKALAAYNAGIGTVRKYGGVPPYEETQRYIR